MTRGDCCPAAAEVGATTRPRTAVDPSSLSVDGLVHLKQVVDGKERPQTDENGTLVGEYLDVLVSQADSFYGTKSK